MTHQTTSTESLLWVAAVGIGAAPHHVEPGVVGADDRGTPRGRAGVEGGDCPGGVAAEAVVVPGQGVAPDRVFGPDGHLLAQVAEAPGDGGERRW